MKKKNQPDQLNDIYQLRQEIDALKLLCNQKTAENENLSKKLKALEWVLKPKQTASTDFVPGYDDLISLVESKKRAESYLNVAAEIIVSLNREGNITLLNDSGHKLLGYKPGELIGKNWFKTCLPEEDHPKVLKLFKKLLQGETSDVISGESQVITKSHARKTVYWYNRVLKDPNGNIAGTLSSGKDISDHKHLEQLLEQTKERYRIISETTSDFSFSCIEGEKGYEIDWIAGAVKRITGYSYDDIKAKKCWRFMVHPDDDPIFVKHVLSLKSGEESECELRITDPAGVLKWLTVKTVCLFDEDNERRKIYGGCEDITERREAADKLRKTRQMMAQAEELTELGSWEWDIKNDTWLLSDNWKRIHGVSDIHLTTEQLLPIAHPDDRSAINEAFARTVEKGEPYEIEHRIIRQDTSEIRHILAKGIVLFDNAGKPAALVGAVQDITRRKQAEEALRMSEARFKSIIAVSNTGAWEFNKDKDYLWCSPEYFTMLGRDPADYTMDGSANLAESWINLLHPDDRDRSSKHFADYLAGGSVGMYENYFRMRHRDGGWVWIWSRGQTLRDRSGMLTQRTVGTHIDITELKRAEEENKASSEKYKALIEQMLEGLLVVDNDDTIQIVNTAFCKMLGYDDENDLLGKTGYEILLKDTDRDLIIQKNLQRQKGIPGQYEIELLKKTGESIFVLMNASPVKDKTGKVLGSMSTCIDITERKQYEQQLKESEARFKALHNASFGGIAIHDKGLILECNQGLSEITGYRQDELIGMDGLLLIAPEYRELVMNNITAGYEKPYEAYGLRKNGQIFPIRLEARNIPFKGKNVRTVEFRDITESKQAEQQIIAAKEKAQESDRLKSAFLANMSHEIRTPMNGILGFSELLKEPQLTDEQQQKYIEIIEKSGQRMLNIINDIVDISRIESGLMDVSLTITNINDQLDYIYTFFKPQVEAKGIQLMLPDLLPADNATIVTDREKLFAVLTNLVKNAIKYSNEGTIGFGCNNTKTHGRASLQFFVSDTGIGIPKDRQHAIFDRFVQADIEDREARQGAGLGLAISKAYVEMLGGEIWVESEVGKGSTFYFTIPNKKEPTADDDKQKPIESGQVDQDQRMNLKILIVEDDELSAMLMEKHLRKVGKEILKVINGSEAVSTCKDYPDIDLVLMDVKMPGMDGEEATRQIRKFNNDVVIIAQTAKALIGDKQSMLDAGCNDYITKPINKDELYALIEKYFGE